MRNSSRRKTQISAAYVCLHAHMCSLPNKTNTTIANLVSVIGHVTLANIYNNLQRPSP